VHPNVDSLRSNVRNAGRRHRPCRGSLESTGISIADTEIGICCVGKESARRRDRGEAPGSGCRFDGVHRRTVENGSSKVNEATIRRSREDGLDTICTGKFAQPKSLKMENASL